MERKSCRRHLRRPDPGHHRGDSWHSWDAIGTTYNHSSSQSTMVCVLHYGSARTLHGVRASSTFYVWPYGMDFVWSLSRKATPKNEIVTTPAKKLQTLVPTVSWIDATPFSCRVYDHRQPMNLRVPYGALLCVGVLVSR